jgi:hypothetical protein
LLSTADVVVRRGPRKVSPMLSYGRIRRQIEGFNRFYLQSGLSTGARKATQLVALASVVGVLDDLQVRFLDIAQMGEGPEIVYQTCFLGAAALVALWVLRDSTWSRARNLSNLLMIIPIATIADNASIDAGTMKPYLLRRPRQGFIWRTDIFGGTPFLSQVATWVNQQPFGSGILNGYLLACGMAVGYVLLQYWWSRRRPDHTQTIFSNLVSK